MIVRLRAATMTLSVDYRVFKTPAAGGQPVVAKAGDVALPSR